MNIPQNHHYVSQCQIKNFFNQAEGKIFLYDKINKAYFHRNATRRVFSELNSNTKVINDELDYTFLEKDLSENFENKYPRNMDIIFQAIIDNEITPELKDAIIGMANYGIAGEMRPPDAKRETDDAILENLVRKFAPFTEKPLYDKLVQFEQNLAKVPHSNVIVYSKIVAQIYNAMGDIGFALQFINDDSHYLLLPDRSSITQRYKINQYFNPDIEEIAMIGIPLASKIFLHVESLKVRNYPSCIYSLKESEVMEINYCLYQNAHRYVACENLNYLRSFVAQMQQP